MIKCFCDYHLCGKQIPLSSAHVVVPMTTFTVPEIQAQHFHTQCWTTMVAANLKETSVKLQKPS